MRSTSAPIFGKAAKFACGRPDFVPDTISARLAALQVRIVEVVKRTEDEFLKAELQELGRRIRDARVGIVTFLEQSAEGHVYWIERTGKDRAVPLAERRADRYRARPAADDFSRGLLLHHDQRDARASGQRDLAYFRRRIGADGSGAAAARQPLRFHRADEVVRRAKNARSARRRLHRSARALGRAFRRGDGRPRLRSFHQLSRDAAARGRDAAVLREQTG